MFVATLGRILEFYKKFSWNFTLYYRKNNDIAFKTPILLTLMCYVVMEQRLRQTRRKPLEMRKNIEFSKIT